ncbi:MAG TPA: serine/threonine-protein kinase [Gemmatales bacterium]|nr:serine/threonine-protein kinase [Gemmatales bacterium]
MTEETLFELLLKTPEAERPALLDRACEGKPELRARVEALLKADAAPAQFLAQPPALGATTGFGATASYSAGDVPGVVIAGRYKLLEEIGEGGMGTVWMAQQSEPVKRLVAIKLIKAGMDSKAVLARFEAERQALAMMDHPNIAKVLDGGQTEDRRPYFVMELVKGTPITKFCDERKFSLKDRLKLFVPVCQAIQHAHQKGVIHRDIKPSNVLIALYDDKPVPKVIDFGVAKATGAQLTEQTLNTGFGAIVGTPEYMSPEQASLNNLDIDTRSDVYALGVLLYELLTGTTPVDRKSLKQAALLEILRIIREVEPSRPSTKLSTAEALPTIAANRHMEPARLSKMMKGELDWIVMKALEKDRTRRYETANGLARDIQRYLCDEAVEARPASVGYRFSKFVKRNKGTVIAATIVLLVLIAGIVGTSWEFYLESQRAEGEKEAKLQAQKNLEHAQTNLAFAKKGNEILGSIFAGLEPKKIAESGRPLQDVLREKLGKAVKDLEGSAIGDPLEVAAMQITLGQSLMGLGAYGQAIEVLDKAFETQKARLGVDHPKTLVCMGSLAVAFGEAGQLDKSLRLSEESLKLNKARLGESHSETLTSMNNLAIVYAEAGKRHLVVELHEEIFKLMKTKLGADDPDTLVCMHNLAAAYTEAGKTDQAKSLYVETIQLMKTKLGADHPDTLRCMGGLAMAYKSEGKFELALELFEKTLKLTKTKLGADHPETLSKMAGLASCYQAAGKFDQSLSQFEETLKLMKVKLGADHPYTLRCMVGLAQAYQTAGKLDLAMPLCEETLNLTKAKLGAEHPTTLAAMSILASANRHVGKFDLALTLSEEAFKLLKAKLGDDHPGTLTSMQDLADAYIMAGKLDQAQPVCEESLKLHKAKLGADHPSTLSSMNSLALIYQRKEKYDKAVPLFDEILKQVKAKFGAENPNTLTIMGNLADTYSKAGKLDQAVALHLETLRLRKANLGADHPQTIESMHNLAVAYWLMNRLDLSIPLFEKTLELQEKKQGKRHPETLKTMACLGENYKKVGRIAEALPLLEAAFTASKEYPELRRVGSELIDGYVKAGQPPEKARSIITEMLANARRQLPPESLQLADQLATIGQSMIQIKAYTEAEAIFRESLSIRIKQEPDKWRTFNMQSLLGGALLGQKKYAAAEPLLLKGYEGMKKREKDIPLQGKPRLPEALDRLIQFYTETTKADEVKKWQAEKEKLPKMVEKK